MTPSPPDLLPGNRRARYYSLTRAGRKHLDAERAEFDELVAAIQRVLKLA